VEASQQLTDATNGCFRAEKVVMSPRPGHSPVHELHHFPTTFVVTEDTRRTLEASRFKMSKQGVDSGRPGTGRAMDRFPNPNDAVRQVPTWQRLFLGHSIDNAICGGAPPESVVDVPTRPGFRAGRQRCAWRSS
jgi:hypothetical protein